MNHDPVSKSANDDAAEPSTSARVPFTVEVVQLDTDPIVLQPKPY